MRIKKFDEKWLKKMGVAPHQVKDDYGCDPLSFYDIYDGGTITIRRHKTAELYYDTGMTRTEFFEFYGSQSKGERK